MALLDRSLSRPKARCRVSVARPALPMPNASPCPESHARSSFSPSRVPRSSQLDPLLQQVQDLTYLRSYTSQPMIRSSQPSAHSTARNVLGGPLLPCSTDPMTGFYRTGCCDTGPDDQGSHTVCIVATESFLAFSQSVGNDLSTPQPSFGFPGLRPGDQWCLCAPRWQEAFESRPCAPSDTRCIA